MKRKNIVKSVVLGLILASIGNCVCAEEDNTRVFQGDKVFNETLGGLWGSKDDVKVVDGSLTINVTDKSFNSSWEDDGTHNVSLNASKNININTSLSQSNGYSASIDVTNVTKNTEIISGGNINITSNNSHVNPSYGIIATYLNSKANITAIGNLNIMTTNIGGYNYGLNVNYGIMNVQANDILIDTESNTMNIAIQAMESGSIEVDAKGKVDVISKGNNSYGIWSYGNTQLGSTKVNVNSLDNVSIASGKTAIFAQNGGTVNIDSNTSNIQSKNGTAIRADSGSKISLIAAKGMNLIVNENGTIGEDFNAVYNSSATVDLNGLKNVVAAGIITHSNTNGFDAWFGNKTAVFAEKGAKMTLNSTNEGTGVGNMISGTLRAENENTDVQVKAEKGNNYIYSSAHGRGYKENIDILSAVFGRDKADILIDGNKNFIATYCGHNGNESQRNERERVIWAQGGANITINGATTIIASRAEQNIASDEYGSNSYGAAITAGSEMIVKDGDELARQDNLSRVIVNYAGSYEESHGNYISGDVLSGYNGSVKIAGQGSEDNIYVNGNVLAANGGIVDISLGDGGILQGRVDDYEMSDGDHSEIYHPSFSNDITAGGTVNLNLGKGSTWNVDGQSWVTKMEMHDSIVNIVPDDNEFHEKARALTIRNIADGSSGTFVMELNHNDHMHSDMLYIGNIVGKDNNADNKKGAKFDIVLTHGLTGWEHLSTEELRFATVLDESIVFENVTLHDAGINDVEFKVGHEDFRKDDADNKEYNGDELSSLKPGEDMVENTQGQDKINWYINGILGYNDSDAGKTIINMSRANYSNAVYMDRLNKRMGEMRYVNENDGLWVRMRHDRIGKDNSFRSKNTMYEIGYDKKLVNDGGEHRTGIAMDYMDGSTEYSEVAGKGEIKRKGMWLYDTRMGDKGHYTDYVVKWGHLNNEFDILTMATGEKVTGDYSNDVFSISAEYGKKNEAGNGWYFEPQAQLQYARVTDADYVTSQGSEVSLDAINSLIGRVGFRLGKDMSERSSVYVKADVLHEFLGDQTIYAKDGTGVMDRTYENKGTWYDVGFGFTAATSDNSYAYIDFEKSFGNDNDETYQINAGMNWSF